MNWQPIETAPLDGTKVLLAFAGWRNAVIGHWVDQQTVEYGEVKRSYQHWWTGAMKMNLRDPDPIPTHWMPLPALPELDPVQNAVRVAKQAVGDE